MNRGKGAKSPIGTEAEVHATIEQLDPVYH